MATSLRDLLAELISGARVTSPTRESGDDAAAALGHLGRALNQLAAQGLDPKPRGMRETATERLAAACNETGGIWRGLPAGRLAAVAGALADIVGVITPETSPTERWAITLRVGAAARHLTNLATSHPPYNDLPELSSVREAARDVRRVGATDPDALGHGHVALDRLLPRAFVPHGMSRMNVAAESAIALADQVRRHVRPDGPGLSVFQAVVVMRACEAAAARAIEFGNSEGALPGTWRYAATAWRAAWLSLRPYRDGLRAEPRPGGSSDLMRCAVAMARSLDDDVQPGSRGVLDNDARVPLRIVTNQLPRIADQLEIGLGRWAATGQLFAYANDLPFQDDNAAAWFRGEVITPWLRDLEPAATSIRTAGLLSAALSVGVDSVAVTGEARPQPHLTASYTAAVRAAQPELEARAATALVRVAQRPHPRQALPGPRR